MLTAAVSTACLYPLPTEEALYDLAVADIRSAEVFLNTHAETEPRYIDELRRIFAHFDMRCTSLHPYTSEIEPLMLFSNYPRRLADFFDYCRRYFTAMEKLGAKIFVLHGNKVPPALVNRPLYWERFARLAELGRTYGVTVAQENVARCTGASLAFLLEMKQALGQTAQFVLDVKQAVRAGEDPQKMLEALGENVAHVHISDHGSYGDCLLLGRGRLDLTAFLQTLHRVSPDAAVVLELYRSGFSATAELAANYHFLQNRIRTVCVTGERKNNG